MKRYYHIWTVGCQMNKADSENLGRALEGRGYLSTDQAERADVIVLNTCSVRQHPEERVVGKLNSLVPLKRRNPGLIIALAGCMVGPDATDLHRELPAVDVFLRPSQVDALLEALPASPTVPEDNGLGGKASRRRGEVTAYVPVTYGCDNFCSYCIVPYRRGRERSRPVAEITAEIEGLVADGVREVTLLGQNVNSYGRNLSEKADFADLLTAVNEIRGLWRVRFVTSHPKDMSERLIETIASLPKVCEYINLPVQAGDDLILERMRRGYTTDSYRRTVAAIRQAIPGVALSTDVIVGFPGETHVQFQHTFDLLKEIRFDAVHIASFSPRPGTIAAKMEDDVPPAQKKEHQQALEELQTTIATEINARLLGGVVEVLVEDSHKGKWRGRSRTNKLVFFESDEDWRGRLALVHITETSPWSLQGEFLRPQQGDLDQAA